MATKRISKCLLNYIDESDFKKKLKHDIGEAIKKISIEENYNGRVTGLHLSYQIFLQFFANKTHISAEDLILAAQFSYGWMPTINNMKNCDPDAAFEGFNALVHQDFSFNQEPNEIKSYFEGLLPLTNNSLVGASKLLHFAKPDVFAIWDSRIFSYFYPGRQMHGQELAHFDRYIQYHRLLTKLSKDVDIQQLLAKLKSKLIIALPKKFRQNALFTNNRCLEFVMYSTAKLPMNDKSK